MCCRRNPSLLQHITQQADRLKSAREAQKDNKEGRKDGGTGRKRKTKQVSTEESELVVVEESD